MSILTALFLGDLIGQPGLRAVFFKLKSLIKSSGADLVVVNGENAAGGFGLLPEQADQLWSAGVDVITTGNHIWQQREIYPYLESKDRLLRPGNYSKSLPGKGWCQLDVRGYPVVVGNFQGRTQMTPIDDPFSSASELIKRLGPGVKNIFIDFHAESTEEKEAFAFHLDGKVSAVLGTHTHVASGDERILPGGTFFLSDLGMCGPEDSVIGSDPAISVKRSLTQMPLKLEIKESPCTIRGAALTFDPDSGKVIKFTRIHEKDL